VPLSWNEIRQRSIAFAREWSEAARERAEALTFWSGCLYDRGPDRFWTVALLPYRPPTGVRWMGVFVGFRTAKSDP